MENNKYRNTNDIDDTEYRQMRKSEDSSYEYHGKGFFVTAARS